MRWFVGKIGRDIDGFEQAPVFLQTMMNEVLVVGLLGHVALHWGVFPSKNHPSHIEKENSSAAWRCDYTRAIIKAVRHVMDSLR